MAERTSGQYLFVKRPVLAIVISITITLVGVLMIRQLPINQYPPMTPPAIQVSAQYVGATAQDVATAVAAPIEQQLDGLAGLLYYSSSNGSDGSMNLSVFFDPSRDQDLAAVDVQNAINVATARLPASVRQNGITVRKASTQVLLVGVLTSDNPQDDNAYLTNYGLLYVAPEVKRLPGVGDATFFGAYDFSMLLSLDPEKMARLGITVSDVREAVTDQNAVKPGGRLGREPSPSGTQLTIPVSTQGQLTTPEEFGNIIVRALPNGSVVRVKDIAQVRLGSLSYDLVAKMNGKPSAGFAVYARPNANALAVKKELVARMEELARAFPPGLHWRVAFDTTPVITESIREVVITLLEAFLLVALVVFAFLQSWRATLIPLLAVPVSLVGTFIGLRAFGFSMNILTLFGMVLAIGIVVDDAIVVIENVERIMARDEISVREATSRAMGQIAGALVAIVLALCAVFVSVMFVGGIVGTLYRQFAVTIVVSVVLSGMVALTLTPALCAVLLTETTGQESHGRFFRRFNTGFARLTDGYVGAVSAGVARRRSAFASFAIVLLLIGILFIRVPGGFIPTEDKGYFAMSIRLPDGASLQRTTAVLDEVTGMLRTDSSVANVISVAGLDLITLSTLTNAATVFVMLEPWSERKKKEQQLDEVVRRANMKLFALKQAIGFAFNFPEIPGLGTTAGLQLNLQQRGGGSVEDFANNVREFTADANRVAVDGAQGQVNVDAPQLFVSVDEDATHARGVNTSDVFNTLQTMFSTLYINDFSLYGKPYRVQAEAMAPYRQRPEDVGRMYVRGNGGAMIPLSALVHSEMRSAPSVLTRFDGFTSALITGTPKPGQSTGQMLAAVEKLIADKYAARGVGYAYSGESYEEQVSSGNTVYVLALAMLIVFLVLAGLYESWSIPFAVLLGVPFGLFGAILAVWVRHMPNDVYFQAGLFAVIGLAAKNAILIVEFANQLREQGMSIYDATVEAARERLRPILMTSLAFIFGTLPLLFASGAGAVSRHSIGTSVFFGMIGATVIGIFFIPLFFYTIRSVVERRGARSPASAPTFAGAQGD
jgi:hydrophobe/amphiphile efflux-1 (HAE1) family protein